MLPAGTMIGRPDEWRLNEYGTARRFRQRIARLAG